MPDDDATRTDANRAIAVQQGAMVKASGADEMLQRIRPEWQATGLIDRVRRLLNVDPSSACQRLLNAAFHDLRKKVVVAGLDIAREAAKNYKLPTVDKADDVLDDYSPTRVLELSYRMGILSRAEWRRLQRTYDIRRDLEHEDDEYEATVEDVIYVFTSCIDIVLSREPMQIIRIQDIKDVVEAPERVIVPLEYIQEYRAAPKPRQEEILSTL